MKKTLLLLLVIIACRALRAQTVRYPVSVPYWQAIYSPFSPDAFSCAANPASLPYLKGFSGGVFSEKRFMMEGLGLYAVSAAYGARRSGYAAMVTYFGSPFFNETRISLNYGKSLGKINIGAVFNFDNFNIAGFEKHSAFHIGATSIWKLSDKVYSSFQLINPFKFSQKEISASIYRMGIGYDASSEVYVAVEAAREEDRPLNITAVIHYRFSSEFYAKAGISTASAQPFFAAGWIWKDFRVCIMVNYHASLGASPAISLVSYKPSLKVQE